MKLLVNEIFYSLQGEGARAGTANIFIRLAGCKAQYACRKAGIVCDTNFDPYTEMSVAEILDKIKKLTSEYPPIIWTGGEPTDQLKDEFILSLKECGYYFHAIETSGIKPVPNQINYVTLSPKVSEELVQKNFPNGVDELRYVIKKGKSIPVTSVNAFHYYLSPHSDGEQINRENLQYCIGLVKQNPQWKLSMQQHKIWNVR